MVPMPPDAPLDDPFLIDAFDFSRYPTSRTVTNNAKWSVSKRHRGRIALFSNPGNSSPINAQHPRNVSEPQLISSTNFMRESWFPGVTSSCTADDIANLSSSVSSDDDNIPKLHPSQSATVDCRTPGDRTWCGVDDDGNQTQKTSPTLCEDSPASGFADSGEPSVSKSEEDSFYSMDSADQDAHRLLLSMPIIPQIKLQRKATVRDPEPVPFLDDMQNRSFLSPRIRDLRTPARMSSRRYGRILARTSHPTETADAIITGLGAHDRDESRRTGNELGRSASEPVLSTCPSDNEEEPLLKEVEKSLRSDVLLSSIDQIDSSPRPQREGSESDVGDLAPSQAHKHQTRGHRRSSMSFSRSFSSIIHAAAGGCVSLDRLLRKPKMKSQSAAKNRPDDDIQNPHDPTSKWASKQGQIVIKVFVPSTDDIWKFRVPQNISLADFRSRVKHKLGLPVSFSGSLWDEPKYHFRTDERFKSWINGRIRFGRNLPLVAHLPPPLPLVRLSVDADGCEVWCYA